MKIKVTFFPVPFHTFLGKKFLQRKKLVNLRNDFLQMFVATLHKKLFQVYRKKPTTLPLQKIKSFQIL